MLEYVHLSPYQHPLHLLGKASHHRSDMTLQTQAAVVTSTRLQYFSLASHFEAATGALIKYTKLCNPKE